MQKVISVRQPEIPYLADLVVYLITKSGWYINQSQAQFLIGRGDVKVNGEVVRKTHHLVDHGMNVLEVHGRFYPFDVVPAGMEQ